MIAFFHTIKYKINANVWKDPTKSTISTTVVDLLSLHFGRQKKVIKNLVTIFIQRKKKVVELNPIFNQEEESITRLPLSFFLIRNKLFPYGYIRNNIFIPHFYWIQPKSIHVLILITQKKKKSLSSLIERNYVVMIVIDCLEEKTRFIYKNKCHYLGYYRN